VSWDVVVVAAPPLALLLLPVLACAWLALGDRGRRERQARLAAALRPRGEMGPPPHGRAGRSGARSSRPNPAAHSLRERSST
jgi:hypothetical protein